MNRALENLLLIGVIGATACSPTLGLENSDNAEPPGLSPTEDSPYGPARYAAGQVHSPINEYVVDNIWEITNNGMDRQDDVFMKVGASSTVSSNTLHCFSGDNVDLSTHDTLDSTLSYFLGGDAGGTDPFGRWTVAAESGRSASWALSGTPSPVAEEINAINPRYALVHYGTNDMGMGSTYLSALVVFYDNMMTLSRTLTEQGIIPVFTGISPRADSQNANLWVPTYNAVIRGMAQAWQTPFIDLHEATWALDGHGLSSDGVHLNGYSDGACVLTEEGLNYGYNVRNLIVLQALDRLQQVIVGGADSLDETDPDLPGDGSPDAPWAIEQFPFVDLQTTTTSPHRNLYEYSGCDSDSDESGAEWLYAFEIDEATSIRAVVLDEGDVDVDIHLLDATGTEEGCIARGHHALEADLDAGSYLLALDTWFDGEEERDGAYLLTVLECSTGDDCTDA